MAVEKIQVPDLGTEDAVEVIEVLVKAGDTISENDSLVTLESDKAAMEIPSPKSGTVKQVLVKVGDQVKTGAQLLEMETAGAESAEAKEEPKPAEAKEEPKPAEAKEEPKPEAAAPAAASAPQEEAKDKAPVQDQQKSAASTESPQAEPAPATGSVSVQTVNVPDLGGAEDVDVIEILVKVGDEVKAETGLVTLETDKAAMEVPSPMAGKVTAINVKVGDKVAKGSPLVDLETTGAPATEKTPEKAAPEHAQPEKPEATAANETAKEDSASAPSQEAAAPADSEVTSAGTEVYAGPAVRKLARELGVDLQQVKGTGAKGRIVKEDLQAHVKTRMKQGPAQAGAGMGVPGIPDIDFSKFGRIEEIEMSKVHRVTAVNMTRNWLNVPHVTQFDEADVTELEEFRAAQKALAEKKDIKLTPLPFIVKACAHALNEHPQFNVSLHSSGTKLIRKHYINIGVAVATPAGLMVPVIKDADKKSVWQIAAEIAALSAKAKDRKLTKEDMEGSCFTVSSLGNIGGTGFTPIVSAPEVAILGVSRASIKPVYKDGQFVPRTMLPFSLSYDHRAVNGVDGGMFCTYLASILGDIRLMVL